MLSSSPQTLRPASIIQEPRALFVPVDAGRAASASVDLALRLARSSLTSVVLLGVLAPSPPVMDIGAEGARAQLALSELQGLPILPRSRLDREARLVDLLRSVLLPLQRRLEASGVPTRAGILPEQRPLVRLHELLHDTHANHAIVLCNPRLLSGPLRDLSTELLLRPPCTVYICGMEQRGRWSHGLPARLWRHHQAHLPEWVALPWLNR